MPKKPKAVAVDVRCGKCGNAWSAGFPSGVVKRVLTCHHCGTQERTSVLQQNFDNHKGAKPWKPSDVADWKPKR